MGSKQITKRISKPSVPAKTDVEFPISSDIPIPESRGRHAKYPWDQMKIGDSFFVPGQTSQTFSPARQYAQTTRGHVYVSRTVTEGRQSGVRIWRTE